MKASPPSPGALRAVEDSVIALFVQLAGMFSLPRSVGEIYGLLFLAPDPMALDDIAARLALSKGSASQGIRFLVGLGALRKTYRSGDRRDHYEAEDELRKIARGFIQSHIQPEIDQTARQLAEIDRLASKLTAPERRAVKGRLERLAGWHRNSGKLLPLVKQFVKL